jgi:hypothetical protein
VAREKGLTAGAVDRARYLHGHSAAVKVKKMNSVAASGKSGKNSKNKSGEPLPGMDSTSMTESDSWSYVADETQVHHLVCGGTFRERLFVTSLQAFVSPYISTESHGRKVVYCDTFGSLPFTRVLRLLDGQLRLKLG